MRKRFNGYLGYERHQKQFDEDFWQRRQTNLSSIAEAERKRHKQAEFHAARESISEKAGRNRGRMAV